jgi:uncharacterized protein
VPAPFELLAGVAAELAATLWRVLPYLAFGTVAAAALSVYVGVERIAVLFRRRPAVAVGGSVAAAVGTPFCSCGTTAVILSMLAAAVPWAPVVAFMVASPLSSPTELFLSAGLFGWPFALLFFGGSIALGVLAGAAAYLAERAGLLEGQARFRAAGDAQPLPAGIGPGAASVAEFTVRAYDRWRLRSLVTETLKLGRRMLLFFVAFAGVGYLIVAVVPDEWITSALGGQSLLAVLIAASLGAPFYVSSEASLPLVATLVESGMGIGPAMAFLVTGAGTSIGALAGALLIARWRVLAIVVGVLWAGAIGLGLLAGVLL